MATSRTPADTRAERHAVMPDERRIGGRAGQAKAANAARGLLQARELAKSFYDAGAEVRVLRGLNLEVFAGERLGIVGQSGVGKSTLLYILGTLERPSAGQVLFDGVDLFSLGERDVAEFRNRNLGFVFQFHYLMADFSAIENVMMPALIARMAEAQARSRAAQVLELVGLGEKLHRRPGELSGGEQQRVAVARAVVLEPRLVLADEPTGNLDPHTAEEVHELLTRLNYDLGVTLVVATHNERLTRLMDRTLRLAEGRLTQAG